ncbi:MAG: hypothetical protein IKS48_07305 [Eubacterium sp.]|nr:hypothetical protein [Eubacterium sp.]
MTLTQEDAKKWLPFIQAVAEGKEILMWTGLMESVDPVKEGHGFYSTEHSFKDPNGNRYASLKETEYQSLGNMIVFNHGNKEPIYNPELYFKIKE